MSFGFLMILAVAAINYHFVDAYSSSTGKIGDLNGAHLKIAVGHVSCILRLHGPNLQLKFVLVMLSLIAHVLV